MNTQKKNNIRSKIRLIYGLTHVLKYDVDNLRLDANEFDILQIKNSLQDTNETLEKIVDTVAEIEYIIYLDEMKGSQ